MCCNFRLSRFDNGCAWGVGDRCPAKGDGGDGEYTIVQDFAGLSLVFACS